MRKIKKKVKIEGDEDDHAVVIEEVLDEIKPEEDETKENKSEVEK